jgi:hypothetical protein
LVVEGADGFLYVSYAHAAPLIAQALVELADRVDAIALGSGSGGSGSGTTGTGTIDATTTSTTASTTASTTPTTTTTTTAVPALEGCGCASHAARLDKAEQGWGEALSEIASLKIEMANIQKSIEQLLREK